jgi:long-chain acyl-CoA synthetase
MKEPPPEVAFIKRWMRKASHRLLLALFNVFPLPQMAGFRQSFEFAGQCVDRGYSILVFPEGMRTQDGKMNSFRAGIGILATNLNIPVVPIKIDGLFELKRAGKKVSWPGAVRVTVGPAARYDAGSDSAKVALDLETRVGSM